MTRVLTQKPANVGFGSVGVAGALGAGAAFVAVAAAWRASSLESGGRWWVVPVALVVGAAFGAGIGPVRNSIRTPGVLPFAVVCSAAAVYGCVPETGQMREIGWTVALVVVLEVVLWAPLALVWHAGSAALVLWGGLYGATGRPSALIGALFAMTPVPLLAFWLRLRPRFAGRGEPYRWTVLAVGSVAVVAMARTGGIEPGTDAGTAAALRWLMIWVAAALVASGAIVITAGRAARRDRGSSIESARRRTPPRADLRNERRS